MGVVVGDQCGGKLFTEHVSQFLRVAEHQGLTYTRPLFSST